MKYLICLLFVSLFSGFAKAQFSERLNRHFIISIDGALASVDYRRILQSDGTRRAVEDVLKSFQLTTEDYVSIVSYRLNLSDPRFDSFVYVSEDKNDQKILWRHLNGHGLSELGDWADIVYEKPSRAINYESNKASFQSGAKPYILQSCRSFDGHMANETFVIMLTDNDVNGVGNNWGSEWYEMYTAQSVSRERFLRCEKDVQETITATFNRFQFKPYDVCGKEALVLGSGYAKNGKSLPYVIMVYKVEPFKQPLQAITHVPAPFPIRRVRGGYRIDFDLPSHNSAYEIDKIDFKVSGSNEVLTSLSNPSILKAKKLNDDMAQAIENRTRLQAKLRGQDLDKGDTVELKVWISYKDRIYGGVTMNPYDSCFKDGLVIRQIFTFPNEAKVFGIFPMFDLFWWFWPDDIQKIVIFWDVIITILVTLLIIWVIRRYIEKKSLYIPNDKRIKIKKI